MVECSVVFCCFVCFVSVRGLLDGLLRRRCARFRFDGGKIDLWQEGPGQEAVASMGDCGIVALRGWGAGWFHLGQQQLLAGVFVCLSDVFAQLTQDIPSDMVALVCAGSFPLGFALCACGCVVLRSRARLCFSDVSLHQRARESRQTRSLKNDKREVNFTAS